MSRSLVPVSLTAVPPALCGGVVAIGSFDGMHEGHRVLLERARGEARRLGGPAIVLTFEPHPRTVLRPETPVFRLTPLAAKARLLAALGIDGLVVATFDRAFAANTPQDFIDRMLVGTLQVKGVVVGYNFHFGKGRAGTPAMLIEAGARSGFTVTVVPPVTEEGGEAISSTAIRANLAAGEVALANRRLGYRWFVVGEVMAGDRRGRELGFPTANLALGEDCGLRHGIYAVRLTRADGTVHDGVASFGRRPTFDNGPPLLEAHLFDFSGDLYGETVSVAFLGWIRPEEKFASVPALIEAMQRDSVLARAMLAAAGAGSALDQALAGGG